MKRLYLLLGTVLAVSVACGHDTRMQGLHAPCTGQSCANGQTCMHWCGFAGCTQDSHDTCELACQTDADCPGGLKCRAQADALSTLHCAED